MKELCLIVGSVYKRVSIRDKSNLMTLSRDLGKKTFRIRNNLHLFKPLFVLSKYKSCRT